LLHLDRSVTRLRRKQGHYMNEVLAWKRHPAPSDGRIARADLRDPRHPDSPIPVRSRLKRDARKNSFFQPFQSDHPVQSCGEKYFACLFLKIGISCRPSRLIAEGRRDRHGR
jgi:hypothetical protein